MIPLQQGGGMLLLDKPPSMTSHSAVTWTRRRLGVRRVGHAGTLDPLASGLLPMLIGQSTRLVRFLHDWPKSYVGIIRLGHETPTGDAESLPADACPATVIPPRSVLDAARRRLTGSQLQQPPSFSAKKIGGIPAHRLARRGLAPKLAPVPVTVHGLRLSIRPDGRLCFAARVSSGTYIRTLARDLGRLLGTGAYLESLRRTGIGPLRVRGSLSPSPELDREEIVRHVLSPESIPLPLGSLALDRQAAFRFCGGNRVTGRTGGPSPGRLLRVIDPDERLLGVGELLPDGDVQPRVVLAPRPLERS